MKPLIVLISVLFFLLSLPLTATAQTYEPTDKMGFIISTGYKHLSLRNSTYDVATLELSLYNHWNKINFNGSFHYGKDYLSMEPCSLFGMLLFYFVKYGEGGGLEEGGSGLVIGALALSSMSFNIHIGNYDAQTYSLFIKKD